MCPQNAPMVSDLFAVSPYQLLVLLDGHAATPSGKSCASLASSFADVIMIAPRRVRRICPRIIHPSAWKIGILRTSPFGHSANFAFKEFSEVRDLCSMMGRSDNKEGVHCTTC